MVMKTGINGEARVLEILRSVKWIESWDLAQRADLMDNTAVKYVKYLRDAGHVILSERVEGKSWCRYSYIAAPQQMEKKAVQKKLITTMLSAISDREDPQEKIDRWMKIAATYPHDHPQLPLIMAQIHNFEAKQRRMA